MRKTSRRLVKLAAILLVACPLLLPSGAASSPFQVMRLKWVDMATTPTADGYWTVLETGDVRSFGAAQHQGDAANLRLERPVVSMAAHPSGQGYWLAAADGGVFAFGSSRFHGSAANLPLAAPIVGIERTPSGNGYWLLGEDGGVFAFGDAGFFGRPTGRTAVGISATASGRGYFVAHGGGGPFAFGDARAESDLTTPHGDEIIVDVAPAPENGSWLVDFRGSVYLHNAPRGGHGDASRLALQAPIVAIVSTPSGNGYWLLGEDGGVFAYGGARFYGRP